MSTTGSVLSHSGICDIIVFSPQTLYPDLCPKTEKQNLKSLSVMGRLVIHVSHRVHKSQGQ